ncbi:MAG: 30S ribosomal protein S17e [Candidatus Diapherotrites archaeon]|nr:30S ribosomal protein S17e [Candidatus Diapherotrites archaeon]
MGKAVPKIIKTRALQLIELYKDKFTTDFYKNKEFVKSLELPLSKTTVNKIVGYITRVMKKASSQ